MTLENLSGGHDPQSSLSTSTGLSNTFFLDGHKMDTGPDDDDDDDDEEEEDEDDDDEDDEADDDNLDSAFMANLDNDLNRLMNQTTTIVSSESNKDHLNGSPLIQDYFRNVTSTVSSTMSDRTKQNLNIKMQQKQHARFTGSGSKGGRNLFYSNIQKYPERKLPVAKKKPQTIGSKESSFSKTTSNSGAYNFDPNVFFESNFNQTFQQQNFGDNDSGLCIIN